MHCGVHGCSGEGALSTQRRNLFIEAPAVVSDCISGHCGIQELSGGSLRTALAAAPQPVQHGALLPSAPGVVPEDTHGRDPQHDEDPVGNLQDWTGIQPQPLALWCHRQHHDHNACQQEVINQNAFQMYPDCNGLTLDRRISILYTS